LVKLDDVTADGAPPPLPDHCHVVFAVIAVIGANVAVVYTASRLHLPPLWICDVRATPFYGQFFRDVAARLKELVLQCGVGFPPAIFVPAELVRHVEGLGLVVGQVPDWFDPEMSLLVAAEIVASRRVLFCQPVVEKMASQEIAAALAFKAGDEIETALRAALIAAVALKYDQELPSRPRKRA
jgi:hypothetical protein